MRPMGQGCGSNASTGARTIAATEVLMRLSLALVRVMGQGSQTLVGSWGNAPSRSPQRAKLSCSKGVKGRSSLRGMEQRSIAALPQKRNKSHLFCGFNYALHNVASPKVEF